MNQEYSPLGRYCSEDGYTHIKRDIEQIMNGLRSKKIITSFYWNNETSTTKRKALSISVILNTNAKYKVIIFISLFDLSRKSPSKTISQKRFFYQVFLNQRDSFKDISERIRGIIIPYYQGFKAEDLAEEILTSCIRKRSSMIILACKKGTVEEDNRGVDFMITGLWKEELFDFVFDLKSGRTGQEQAKRRHGHTPTILMKLEDLGKKSKNFIKKVEKLALLTYQVKFLNKKFHPYEFHI